MSAKIVAVKMEDQSSKPTETKTVETPQDIPIFLRKTYHMVDSCDPAIACWSEDGETFVVKDPTKFEKTIIPQFFKHSKFSSFVRQLNFYAFRKIKYVDTIRIDPKLEAETANYWRFRHEKFQRGMPNLLSEIKRMNGQKGANKAGATNGNQGNGTSPSGGKINGGAAGNNGTNGSSEAIKSELDTLKKKIEDMTKNMDQLTTLVQKVSLKQEDIPEDMQINGSVSVGNKRKKLPLDTPTTLPVSPTDIDRMIRPDEMLSMDLDEDFPPLPVVTSMMASLPDPPSTVPLDEMPREMSAVSDEDFVDKLFTVFSNPEDELLDSMVSIQDEEQKRFVLPNQEDLVPDSALSNKGVSISRTTLQRHDEPQHNRPNPELMDQLSEALAVLPKSMQESIVERLIKAITSSEFVSPGNNQTDRPPCTSEDAVITSTQSVDVTNVNCVSNTEAPVMPLAAATLAALLSHYSSHIKETRLNKTIPVIPVHA